MSIKSELSLPAIPNPAFTETDADAGYEGRPSIPVSSFEKMVNRLHANDNYMFSQEYDVSLAVNVVSSIYNNYHCRIFVVLLHTQLWMCASIP